MNECYTAPSGSAVDSGGNPASDSAVILLSPAISNGPAAEHSIQVDRAVFGMAGSREPTVGSASGKKAGFCEGEDDFRFDSADGLACEGEATSEQLRPQLCRRSIPTCLVVSCCWSRIEQWDYQIDHLLKVASCPRS